MFCTNCGQPLPEGAKFCPECGTPLAVRPLVEEVLPTEEAHVPEPEAPAEEPITEPEAPAAEPEAAPEAEVIPTAEAEQVSEPKAAPTAEVVLIAEEPPKGLHFTAAVALILTAISFACGALSLLGLMIGMVAGMVILFAFLTALLTPLSFGFGIAAFIIGLKRKHTATWVIGLISALLAVVQLVVGVIALICGVVYLVAV